MKWTKGTPAPLIKGLTSVQKTLITNKCTKSFFINCNTLLHVSTLLGHLQGEIFRCRYTRLHYRVDILAQLYSAT
jgi:hypothetical protein